MIIPNGLVLPHVYASTVEMQDDALGTVESHPDFHFPCQRLSLIYEDLGWDGELDRVSSKKDDDERVFSLTFC